MKKQMWKTGMFAAMVLSLVLTLGLFSGVQNKQQVQAATTRTKAVKKYQKYMKGKSKKKYFKMVTLAGSKVPVLLVADSVISGTKGTSNSCVIYQYVNGKVKKAGKAQSLSTAYPVRLYRKYVSWGGNHFVRVVTSVKGRLEGCNYAENFNGGKACYYRWDVINGACVNRKKVTKKKYESYLKKVLKGKEIKFKKNTAANRSKYLK